MEEFNTLELSDKEIRVDKIVDLSRLYSLIQAKEDFILVNKGLAKVYIATTFMDKVQSGELILSAKEEKVKLNK